MPLSDMQRGNAMGLWKMQYPHLASNLGDPQRLRGMADMYGNMAMKADMKADAAGYRDFSTRALQAKQALRELYGIE